MNVKILAKMEMITSWFKVNETYQDSAFEKYYMNLNETFRELNNDKA